LRTFISRLEREEKIQLQQELPGIMRQFEVGEDGYRQLEYVIEEVERPPMIEVEAYRKKFHPETQPA